MKSAKKSTAKQRRVSESDASLLFFKQGEANAEAELAAYQRELDEAGRRSKLPRWWMLAAAGALAVIAVLLYVASS